ncbi:MAG: hypothetical protein LBD94_01020 [Rickettsiales bacterium]|nr:hypothetical protein [Rickettsiales bacterium]
MKKIILAAFLLALPVVLSAADEQRGPRPDGTGGGKPGGFMEQLTEEQKACVEKQGCPKREMKKPEGEVQEGARPERKEPTEEEKAEMEAERECRKKAFEICGIQMPERPEGMPKGKPEDGKDNQPPQATRE